MARDKDPSRWIMREVEFEISGESVAGSKENTRERFAPRHDGDRRRASRNITSFALINFRDDAVET